MEDYEIRALRDMSPEQRIYFQTQFAGERKDPTVALLLTFFLGGFGAHQFYLGRVGLGIVYALFCWTLIPGLIALVECFLIRGRVRTFNEVKAGELASQVKMLYPVGHA